MSPYMLAVIAAVMIAIGQILFKKAALYINSLNEPGILSSFVLNGWFLGALLFFGASTIIWVIALSEARLMSIYPITSLAYILVPVGAFMLFGERISVINMIGLAFILVGIILATKGGYVG